mmetsp:Transcript_38525/g.63143  ORF Transcript_38525/g.63143 Transcript_38525/m.63143 type:complete len:184 (+) Transcript_38525:36-587(+)
MGGMCSSCSDDPEASQRRRAHEQFLPEKGKAQRGETQYVDEMDENPTIQQPAGDQPAGVGFALENMGDSLFEDLARFLRTLPPKSKQHIWEHGVKVKAQDGKKTVCETTRSKDQINRLMCDCVIVYVKYLDRNRSPLSTKTVRPHIEHVTQHIYAKYHPLQRDRFENDKSYFPTMLEDYVQSK